MSILLQYKTLYTYKFELKFNASSSKCLTNSLKNSFDLSAEPPF